MWIRKKRYNAIMQAIEEVGAENTKLIEETTEWVDRCRVNIIYLKEMIKTADIHKAQADRANNDLDQAYCLIATLKERLSKFDRPRDETGKFVKK